ncbi:MAG TPA: hypothetical protein VFK97_01145, partial [Candidatus Saccharimonadales bacterium]|nr:hypothetical protein [Candidatus Saccharimonadales bacterium]
MKNLKHFLLVLAGFMSFFGATAIVSASTATTTISSQISAVISLFTTNGTVNVNVVPTGAGAQTIASDTVTVSTNDSSGYTLQLADTDTNTNLVSGANNIAASAGTQTTPVTPEVVNTWGYAVAGVGGFNASGYAAASSAAISGTLKFAGVPSSVSPNTL